MVEIDVGSIVPSTRDLLQVISTKRKGLALVGLIGPESPSEDAARLHELNVSALAFAAPGEAMQLGARSTKTMPSLCLALTAEREGFLAARFCGADGVCIDAAMPEDGWDKLAKNARTMRMLPIAVARDAASAEQAVKAGARAVLVRAASAEEALAVAKALPRTVTVVVEIENADAAAIRALVGHADAAIVPPAVHASPSFAELVAEVDP